MKRITIILLGWMGLITSAQTASFNCENATSTIEKLICNNSELSLSDETLNNLYRTALDHASLDSYVKNDSNLINEQKKWLKNIRNACKEVSCLEKAYEERNAQLEKLDMIIISRVQAHQSANRFQSIVTDYSKLLPTQEQAQFAKILDNKIQSGPLSVDEIAGNINVIEDYDSRAFDYDRKLAAIILANKEGFKLPKFPLDLKDDHFDTTWDIGINTDLLHIDKTSPNTYFFDFRTFWTNSHVCQGSGSAELNGYKLVRIPDKDVESSDESRINENASCKLDILIYPHHIEISGDKNCTEYFACGNSAYPSGNFFRTDAFSDKK
jgi:uncharacterized protein